MATEPEIPRITHAQFEIWLGRHETQFFLQALERKRLDIEIALGNGQMVDSSNADMTHGLVHRALGEQDGLRTAMNPELMLSSMGMIAYPDEEPDADA